MHLLLGFLVLTATSLACQQGEDQVCFDIYNKCPFTIWPGISGSTIPDGGGFTLQSGKSRDVYVPDGWSGNVWARTECDQNFNCDTGFCKNSEQCQGAGGVPPASLAEFTLNGNGGQDYYDVSLVDGYNIPVFIEPIEGTYSTNGGEYDCKRAGGCFTDVNSVCPPELQVVKNRKVVACKSACLAFKTDRYCCRGAYDTPNTCQAQYGTIFKQCCPTAYSYVYDTPSGSFFCKGASTRSPSYRIQFC